MASTRILIGALSAADYHDRRAACLETWAAAPLPAGVDLVFLIGGHPRPARVDRELRLTCPDAYNDLPQKTRAFCAWATTHADGAWDYLFKCDDDTYVALDRLAAYDLQGRDYVGAEWKPGVAYGSGGAGYFLSRKAAALVARHLDARRGSEDLLVGRVLATHGVSLHIEPRLVPFGSSGRWPAPDNDLLTTHALSADAFRRIAAALAPIRQSVVSDFRAIA